jgi:hypothetical protein
VSGGWTLLGEVADSDIVVAIKSIDNKESQGLIE